MKRKTFSIIIISVLILTAWMLRSTFFQPGINDLKGGFKQVISYRNENNTGPVQRVYVVTVADTLWQEMEKYGNYMPHTKYGNTKVYFFKTGSPTPPALFPGKENFDHSYDQYCISIYEKSAMGKISFFKTGNSK